MASRTPAATLRAIDKRDGGRRCVILGQESDRVVPQHRQGGMGGRPDKHRPENVLWLDSLINGWIESDTEWADLAKAYGVKVPLWVRDVSLVPVFFTHEHAWFILDKDGRHEITALDALDRMLDVYGDIYLLWKATADDTDRSQALLRRSWFS